jgi:hypothetical protein
LLVFYASLLPLLILCCGLSIDIGMLELKRVQMQTAADAGVLGAELEEERGTGRWVAAGQADAAVNGFTNGATNTTVAVQQTSTNGPYAVYYNAIQVTITQRVRTIFMGALNGGYQTISTSATALVPPCTLLLGSGSQTQYSFQNASAGMNSTCPVAVNTAASVDGFSTLSAFGINIAGTAANSNIVGGTSQQQTSGAPTFNQPHFTDPLASIPQPQAGSCDVTAASFTSGSATAYPGTYCGTSSAPAVTVSNATVHLAPGLYVITGGASLTNATVTGTGVTLFFTNGSNGAGFGQFKVSHTGSSTSSINLSAATSSSGGAVPGVVFFFDRNWVATSAHDISFDTNSTFSGDGIWYAPHTGIYLWQNTVTFPNYGAFVADNLYFYNTTLMPNGNFSSLPGGSPFRTQSVLVQ